MVHACILLQSHYNTSLDHAPCLSSTQLFHFQESSNSHLPCSLTRNITSHSMKNLAFHSLLRWKIIILPILTTSLIHFSLKGLGGCMFWTWEWKGQSTTITISAFLSWFSPEVLEWLFNWSIDVIINYCNNRATREALYGGDGAKFGKFFLPDDTAGLRFSAVTSILSQRLVHKLANASAAFIYSRLLNIKA